MIKKTTATIGAIAGILGLYTSASVFFDIPVRPAWAWEVKEMNLNQQALKMELYQYQLRGLNAQSYENKKLQREYSIQKEPIPEWVLKEEHEVDIELQEIKRKITNLENQMMQELQ